ncbi:hypothetical protein RPMA_11895 [Tardiphaga alba]|uniref:Uncharacterized protein n=1 Tax=Tardiphaga alba TaxID=340268 RepID=A0ABX8A890_9BRAD|nr:hypothetical protein RPMA_11895 [Tardiphaga alba]
MSDAYDYFLSHAIEATRKARSLPRGRIRDKQRTVARVYHLLAREAAFGPNIQHLNDYRAARSGEKRL